ncbi:hypothetical protein MesoLjLc_21100 [Mesorhizobium sp. L-8-10]|uniref:hypothetical protein n=1 Tax=Mesorhizobium sp. L-8-10 TaxID=2744523 RepID=UPI0019261E5D|nr:hypothetical protein [Mesorhizobium sp. L-8-10]BCH30180.1 hypothetical protein MesoLjLc_21100 [Mesorhizobium sp. L-8-10]
MNERRKAVESQVKARAAVRRVLERHSVHVASRRYSQGRMWARVLIDGEYYDVDAGELALLQAGRDPKADLGLEPVAEE